MSNVCPTGYTELPADMTADEFIWDYDGSQDCDPYWNTALELASYCPYTLAYSEKSTNGKDCVKVVEKGCPNGYLEVPAGWTAENYLLNWIGANVGTLAEQDCDPVMSQDIDVVCLYKLSYSGTSNTGRDCIKIVKRTCTERGLYDTEEDCKSHTGMNCQKVGTTGGVTDECYKIKPSSGGGTGGGGNQYQCDCPEGWYPGPCDGSVGHGSDGNRCDCCLNCSYPYAHTMYPSAYDNQCRR
ncbi:MAG: hypothetical protein IJ738_04245 [Alphaproteobacteria bacterium]|nr:hypothetical protein [Alphaproteobacteria bacterium]